MTFARSHGTGTVTDDLSSTSQPSVVVAEPIDIAHNATSRLEHGPSDEISSAPTASTIDEAISNFHDAVHTPRAESPPDSGSVEPSILNDTRPNGLSHSQAEVEMPATLMDAQRSTVGTKDPPKRYLGLPSPDEDPQEESSNVDDRAGNETGTMDEIDLS